MFTVYKLINLRNGNFYVGCTKQKFEQRIKQHLSLLQRGKHYCLLLQTEFNNFSELFHSEIVATYPEKKLALKRERRETKPNAYNTNNKKEYSAPMTRQIPKQSTFTHKTAVEFLKNLRSELV